VATTDNESPRAQEEPAMVEAVRDQWLIVSAILVLVVGLVAWRWRGR
jgi:hypothetical protein